MFSNVSDFKDTVVDSLRDVKKTYPGNYSFSEPGWWALHAAAIAGVYLLGNKLSNRY